MPRFLKHGDVPNGEGMSGSARGIRGALILGWGALNALNVACTSGMDAHPRAPSPTLGERATAVAAASAASFALGQPVALPLDLAPVASVHVTFSQFSQCPFPREALGVRVVDERENRALVADASIGSGWVSNLEGRLLHGELRLEAFVRNTDRVVGRAQFIYSGERSLQKYVELKC